MAHIRLHVRQADGHLPMICMRCGEPASALKTKKMYWYPRWLLVLVLLGLPGIIILVILALMLRKNARLQAPFCEQHQGHWTLRTVIIWVTTILVVVFSIGSFIVFIALEEARPRQQAPEIIGPMLCVGTMILFVAWMIVIGIMQNTAIRPDEITNTHILLNGVSDAFVEAVEEAEIERRVRLRQWQHEDEAERAPRHWDDEDEQAAPPKPQASDAIEEDRPPRPAPPKGAPPKDAFEQ
jgi:hypothetical protein